MDGFYTTNGKTAMGYYESPDLPYYHSAGHDSGERRKYQQQHQQRHTQLPVTACCDLPAHSADRTGPSPGLQLIRRPANAAVMAL